MVVANLLGLNPGVKRMMFYMQGCTGGASLLSVAESSPASRLLVLCGDVGAVAIFRGPESSLDTSTLIGQSLVADGMAALIVGANPSAGEVPLFHIHNSLSYLLPHTEALAHGHLSEGGVPLCVSRDFPLAMATAIPAASPELKRCLRLPTGHDRPPIALTSDEFNSCFWTIHAAGRGLAARVGAGVWANKTREWLSSRAIWSKLSTGDASHVCILALATTTTAHVLEQSLFADYYFRVTGCQHMTGLKPKLEKICENSGIRCRKNI
ncbi:hypothetical protein L7F22_062859 [Adiantum nelumboides]|nr:hypothetical protein [Adiantum nelumboides]